MIAWQLTVVEGVLLEGTCLSEPQSREESQRRNKTTSGQTKRHCYAAVIPHKRSIHNMSITIHLFLIRIGIILKGYASNITLRAMSHAVHVFHFDYARDVTACKKEVFASCHMLSLSFS